LKQKAHDFAAASNQIADDWAISKIDGGIYVYLTWKHQRLTRKDWEIFLREKIVIAPAFLFSNDTMAMRVNYTRLTKKTQKQFFDQLKRISRELRRS
jgi:DNA-binding transcriptional MocR family regulator